MKAALTYFVCLVVLFCFGCPAHASQDRRPPNIIYI